MVLNYKTLPQPAIIVPKPDHSPVSANIGLLVLVGIIFFIVA